jgi:hypothetical protein
MFDFGHMLLAFAIGFGSGMGAAFSIISLGKKK